MWFWFSLIALICWSGSDLFSKIGCQDADDKYSHLKMVMAVDVYKRQIQQRRLLSFPIIPDISCIGNLCMIRYWFGK